jgi:hypothetical protein
VSVGDIFTFEFDAYRIDESDNEQSSLRPSVYVLDADKNALGSEGAGGSYIHFSGATYDSSKGKYAPGSNIGASDDASGGVYGFTVLRSEVKYIVIHIMAGDGEAHGKDHFLKYLCVDYYEKPSRKPETVSYAQRESRPLYLSGAPAAGWARKGEMIAKSDGSHWTCTFSHRTTLSAAISSGGTSATVTSATGVQNSDVVGILKDDGRVHWDSVTGLSGSSFTISAIGDSAASGNEVVFCRWV